MLVRSCTSRPRALLCAVATVVLLAALTGAAPAFAGASWWRLNSTLVPANLPPGGEGQVVVSAGNFGNEDAKASVGAPIRINDVLPAGLKATNVAAYARKGGGSGRQPATSLVCAALPELSCELPNTLAPYEGMEMVISVKVEGAQTGALNEVSVSGGEGGVPAASRTLPIKVNGDGAPFGVEKYELTPENSDGTIDTQAGSHPYQLTTTLDLNQALEFNAKSKRSEGTAPFLVRDLHFVLPPGLLGNVTVVPQCTGVDFSTIAPGDTNLCAGDTAIGVARVTINEPNNFGGDLTESVPIFNLTPSAGEPARFGLEIDKVPIVLNTAVRTGKDYAVEVSVNNATQAAALLGSQVTFWGVPGDPSHDSARGWECLGEGHWDVGFGGSKPCLPLGKADAPPFLTLPTSCSGTPTTTVAGDSWPHGPLNNEVSTLGATYQFTSQLDGCNLLSFNPTIGIEPDTHWASSPTGLNVKVRIPQESTLSATGLAEADLEETVVALPEGVLASPGAANGLAACSALGMGYEGFGQGLGENSQLENNLFSPGVEACPDAAKIGTMSIKTPLLENELHGSVYLAEQDNNLLEQKLVLYLTAFDPVSGVRVKLAGDVHIDPNTGQLTSTFKNSPPVPFEELNLHFLDGSRASQSTPPLCGNYTTQASFSPWSGAAAAQTSDSFTIDQGAGGGPCQNQLPQSFAPGFQAGSLDSQAGAFSPFSLTISRPDADQPLAGVTMHLPPGAAAMLSSTNPCAEPPPGQEWSCGADSLVGHSTSSSGLGGSPFTLGGSVYITKGYGGAPFGLLVVTPADAGPFHLGNVNVRSKIFVDRNTAAVTVVSDPFPTFVRGVPVQLKQINVTVDRPNFEFNPTNCNPLAVTGTLTGAQGGAAAVSTPFHVNNCQSLPFHPTLTATTKGSSSKANGASLVVKVTSTPGQANIAKTSLILPVALPSRLTTIQKACVDTVFEVNPAACNDGSNIGTATVHTPVLKNPLTGPAYLVSHGGAAFPDVEFVLQGEGITLILDGQTNIKKGITSSTFNSVPDAPVTSFETTLPEGPHSALTANVAPSKKFSLCGAKLVMPTTITGQNGVVIKQETKIPVTGCKGGPVKLTRAQKLAKALKSCRKQFKRSHAKRSSCEKKARKQYGPKKAKGKSGKKK
jgi:hypothetical protein